MPKVETDFHELYALISQESVRLAKTVRVKKDILIEELTEAQKEVEAQHKKAMGVWKKAFNIYQKHITANPGSLQIRNPGEMPKYPKLYEAIKANIRMIKTWADNEITLELDTLRNIFNSVGEAVIDARWQTANYISMVSGAALAKY